MKSEKCWRHKIYGIILALIVVFLICMFLFDFGVIGYIAEVSTQHGSMIAGLIGFLGVLILFYHQNVTTNKLIEAERAETDRELKKRDRIRYKDDAIKLYQAVTNIFREMNVDYTNGYYHKRTS